MIRPSLDPADALFALSWRLCWGVRAALSLQGPGWRLPYPTPELAPVPEPCPVPEPYSFLRVPLFQIFQKRGPAFETFQKRPALYLAFQGGPTFQTFQKGSALYLTFQRGPAFQKGPTLYLAFLQRGPTLYLVFADAGHLWVFTVAVLQNCRPPEFVLVLSSWLPPTHPIWV
ncbi:unnamed protein product [Boreogadus saida]